jgi:hypothetical protein
MEQCQFFLDCFPVPTEEELARTMLGLTQNTANGFLDLDEMPVRLRNLLYQELAEQLKKQNKRDQSMLAASQQRRRGGRKRLLGR